MDLQNETSQGLNSDNSTSEVNDSKSAQNKFMAVLSKDLRVPLNAMIGFASLMRDQNLSDRDRQKFIDKIIANGDELLQIFEDALNYSKLSSGEARVEAISFNISEMLYDIVNTLSSAAEKKELDIHIVFKTPIPQTITSDPLKTRQILSNLIGNCIRYAEGNGFLLISVFCDGSEAQANSCRNLSIEIDDSASGVKSGTNAVDAQHLAKIESTFKSSSEGRPGFLLSQKFAETLHGRLEIKASSLGSGNCFLFSLPTGDLIDVPFLNKKKSPSMMEKLSQKLQTSNRLNGVRILLAEDSADNELVLKFYLSKEGALLTSVQNGLEAVDAAKNNEFDIILMDIEMPLMDGLEATRQIRQSGFQKTIIALTGHALRDDAVKSLKAGCDTHLPKPIAKDKLIAEIQKRLVREEV